MDVLFFNTISDFVKKEVHRRCDLNLSQTRLLLYFDQNHNQPLTMGNLAQDLNISLSTLSRQLQQIKTKKLIQITKSESDSSKIVRLNQVGIKKTANLKSNLDQIEAQLFSKLDQTESDNFIKQLSVLARKLPI